MNFTNVIMLPTLVDPIAAGSKFPHLAMVRLNFLNQSITSKILPLQPLHHQDDRICQNTLHTCNLALRARE